MTAVGQQAFNRAAADSLRRENANPFRANAYVRAAETLESLSVDAREMLRERGAAALAELPAIGVGLASAIAEMAATGHLSRLERLRGGVDPEGLLQSVPGIGASLAHLLHEPLHIGTLEALEIAAGRRVVRGHEGDCAAYYAAADTAVTARSA